MDRFVLLGERFFAYLTDLSVDEDELFDVEEDVAEIAPGSGIVGFAVLLGLRSQESEGGFAFGGLGEASEGGFVHAVDA